VEATVSPRVQPQLLIVFLIIAFQSLVTLGARADFQIIQRTDLNLGIRISGKITADDAMALQELSADMERKYVRVELDSRGGDVRAAMQIGRLVRKYDGHTGIGLDAKCYSSCALIFIAGVSRLNLGELGLHRPYLASEPQNRHVVETHVPLMLSQVKQYVQEMGITDNFYQQMVNTEPSQMVIYSVLHHRALDKLVPFDDPVYQEVEISYDARRFGVTTSEMRQRQHAANELCRRRWRGHFVFSPAERDNERPAPPKPKANFGQNDRYWDEDDCKNAVKWGLSERVYNQGRQKIGDKCFLSHEERKVLNAISKKEKRDHPLVIRSENCVRTIMLSIQEGQGMGQPR
jgi:hypothetical protein